MLVFDGNPINEGLSMEDIVRQTEVLLSQVDVQTAEGAGLVPSENGSVLAIMNARYHVLFASDALHEGRFLELTDAGSSATNLLASVYRPFGENVEAGIGYNFATFSDDLTDLTFDDWSFLTEKVLP
ncbi:MAG: hypothetical protein AAGH70_01945 [Pseudomonadota bacterium]